MTYVARIAGALPKVPWYAFLAYIVLCLVLNVAVAPFVEFRYKVSISSWGILFLAGGVALGVLCCWSARTVALPKPSQPFLARHGFGAFVAVGVVVLLILQAVIVGGAYFIEDEADWEIMLSFEDPLVLSSYYSVCSNNYFLGGIFAIMAKACYGLGGTDPALVAVCGSCVCITTSICLASFVARRIGGAKCGICAFLLMFVFIGLSPHLLIPYSDAYGMLFTTVLLWLYVCVPNPVRWPLMSLVAACGYHVKPTVLAIFGAAALVSACLWLAKRPQEEKLSKRRALTFAGVLAACVAAAALGVVCVLATEAQVGVKTYPEEEAVPAHYLMMGFNSRYDGTFNTDDRNHSWQYHTRAEMTEADMEVWRTRVRTLGPGGIFQLMVRKNLINYDNGDMLFGRLASNKPGEYHGTSPAIMAFYGIELPGGGESQPPNGAISPWMVIAQALWFMVLAGIALCFLRRRPSKAEMAMAFALLLLSGFLLLFECSARYLFLYMPCYVVLAVRGWQAFGQALLGWREGRLAKCAEELSAPSV